MSLECSIRMLEAIVFVFLGHLFVLAVYLIIYDIVYVRSKGSSSV